MMCKNIIQLEQNRMAYLELLCFWRQMFSILLTLVDSTYFIEIILTLVLNPLNLKFETAREMHFKQSYCIYVHGKIPSLMF